MSQHKNPEEMVATTHNLARFSVEYPQLTWMFLVVALVAGLFAYRGLPQRKDPDIPNKVASISCTWPGASPEKMDVLVARKIDEALSLNKFVDKVKSMCPGLACWLRPWSWTTTSRAIPRRSSTTLT
jgi:hypothetical protein